MPDQQDEQPQIRCCGFLRFHASTIVIGSLLFLLPWLLVSLPSRRSGNLGEMVSLSEKASEDIEKILVVGFRHQHGWPFVGVERIAAEYEGMMAGNRFKMGASPNDIDFDFNAQAKK